MLRLVRNLSIGAAILGQISLLPGPAFAGAEDEIAAAAAAWAGTLSTGDLDGITALYAEDAALWGTMAPALIADPPGIRNYFDTAFRAFPGARITMGPALIRVYGDFAVDSGTYRIDFTKDGEARQINARYTFAYRKAGGKWLIVAQHSSPLPQSR